MKIAIIYSSHTGNTERVASAIKNALNDQEIVYFGKIPKNLSDIRADLYFIGSWTDKGNSSSEIVQLIQKMKKVKIAYFGTLGYGGDQRYYDQLFKRIQREMDPSNQVLGYFFCQGKMPIQIRDKYIQLLTQNPEDANLKVSIHNFDEALSHPDEQDLEHAKDWANSVIRSIK